MKGLQIPTAAWVDCKSVLSQRCPTQRSESVCLRFLCSLQQALPNQRGVSQGCVSGAGVGSMRRLAVRELLHILLLVLVRGACICQTQ